jgi:chromosome partitioning protein
VWMLGIMAEKGGVGKTTLAVNLAAWMADKGYRTLLIDLDTQGNVGMILGEKRYPGTAELLSHNIENAIRPSHVENLDLIMSEQESTENARERLKAGYLGELVLTQQIAVVNGRYDCVIVDTGPGLNITHIATLMAADVFLIPINLNYVAVEGAALVLNTRRRIPDSVKAARFLGVVPNQWERVTKESQIQFQILTETFPRNLIWPPVPMDTKLREAASRGKTIWEYAPDSRAVVGTELKMTDGTYRYIGGLEQIARKLEREIRK